MPENKISGNCMICGRPSHTVVCMRCYFNYDYRTYNNKELETKAPKRPLAASPPLDKEEYAFHHWDDEPYDSLTEPCRLDEARDVIDDDMEPPGGWFSRLNRLF
ncbi:MAG: hypothetical protein AB1656_08730 [Candidatus Omnitrophota bacterium]